MPTNCLFPPVLPSNNTLNRREPAIKTTQATAHGWKVKATTTFPPSQASSSPSAMHLADSRKNCRKSSGRQVWNTPTTTSSSSVVATTTNTPTRVTANTSPLEPASKCPSLPLMQDTSSPQHNPIHLTRPSASPSLSTWMAFRTCWEDVDNQLNPNYELRNPKGHPDGLTSPN